MTKTCYLCKKEFGLLTIKKYSKGEIIQIHLTTPEGMTSDARICFSCLKSLRKLSDEQVREQEEIEKGKETRYSIPIIGVGIVIIIIGLDILSWSLEVRMPVAIQYMILAVIVMAIGGYVIFKGKKKSKTL
ncbi:MAG: hypothetical protein ACT4N5_02185 [Nitrosopumilaceae archaeon]